MSVCCVNQRCMRCVFARHMPVPRSKSATCRLTLARKLRHRPCLSICSAHRCCLQHSLLLCYVCGTCTCKVCGLCMHTLLHLFVACRPCALDLFLAGHCSMYVAAGVDRSSIRVVSRLHAIVPLWLVHLHAAAPTNCGSRLISQPRASGHV